MNETFSAIDLENTSSRLELTLFGCMNVTVLGWSEWSNEKNKVLIALQCVWVGSMKSA